MNKATKVINIIVIIGFLILLSGYLLPKHTLAPLGLFFLILPLLTCITIGMLFFDSKFYEKVSDEKNIAKEILYTLGGVFLIGFTWLVSTVVTFIIYMSNNPVSMSTYGTPLYRPQIK